MRAAFRRRPSPALVISIVALVVATAGTGYAVDQLPKNSVGAKQLKKNAVRTKKVKDRSLLAVDFALGQLPRGAKGNTGPRGPGAMWALIDKDASIIDQSGGISATIDGTGFRVDFGASLAHKGVQATNAWVNDDKNLREAPFVLVCGSGHSGDDFCGGLSDHFAKVLTSQNGPIAPHAFYIAAF